MFEKVSKMTIIYSIIAMIILVGLAFYVNDISLEGFDSSKSGSTTTNGSDKTTSGSKNSSGSKPDVNSEDAIAQMQEINSQTLSDIQQLQKLEKEMYDKMEGLSASNKLDQTAKDDIIAKINELSQLRMNLYGTLKNNYDHYQTTAISANNTYDEQSAAVSVVEKELNTAKSRLQMMQDDKSDKLRYISINTYFGKRYDEHSYLMKIVIYMCIPIAVASILVNKQIIPAQVFTIVASITIIVGSAFLTKTFYSMLTRDKMDYDKYDWYFVPPAKESDSPDDSTYSSTSSSNPWAVKTVTCIGEACCDDNSTYDSTQNICVANTASNGTMSNGTTSNSQLGSGSGSGSSGLSSTKAKESMTGNMYSSTYASYTKSSSKNQYKGKNKVDTKLNNYIVF